MQLFRFAKPLDCETLGRQAGCGYQPRALAELALEALPTFSVEFAGETQRLLYQFRLFLLEVGVKGDPQLVIFRAVFGHPIVPDLRIPQLAERAEKLLGEAAQ